jgi:hypothetical protein
LDLNGVTIVADPIPVAKGIPGAIPMGEGARAGALLDELEWFGLELHPIAIVVILPGAWSLLGEPILGAKDEMIATTVDI